MAHTDAEERQVAKKTEEELDSEHSGRITASRCNLYQHLLDTRKALDAALREYRKLSQGDAWDVEYEGGGDFADYLHETVRVLTIARGLMPTDARGEFVSNDQMKAVKALQQQSPLK